jgi:hypothetical protein
MPHVSHLVTTSLNCVGSPPVAVLCESDCLNACVVQSEKKKKSVSVIVGNRKALKKSDKVGSVSTLIAEQLMDDGSVSILIAERLVDDGLTDATAIIPLLVPSLPQFV